MPAAMRKITRLAKELPEAVSLARQGGPYLASYRAEWRHFVDCVAGDTPVQCTLEDGRHALQAALAAVASISLGRPVKVADAPRRLAFEERRAAV